jgi:GTP-binding protein EngB required for normal cell division
MTEVDGILNRVSGLADKLNLVHLQPQIAACRKQFNGGRNSVDVAVLGRFKAGKSSFLNHLAGRDVLPIGVLPLTAAITRLRYGPMEKIVVRFLNGSAEAIPPEDIGAYVGENHNPNNQKQVASVEVELPALKLLEPLEFVDTPGLGSAFAHNTETTFQWLPNVGAALVALSCESPLSEHDLELLEELRRHTPKIVLLLTKADLLDEPQRAEVLAFVEQQIHQKWGMDLPVFFYSVRPEFAVFKSKLEKHLLQPLIRNRDETASQIGRHKLLSLVERTLEYLRVALAVATQTESSRASLRAKLADERRRFDLFREELQVLSRKWSAEALDQSLLKLKPQEKTLQGRVADAFQKQVPQWPSRLPPLLRIWREWLETTLKHELTEISSAEREIFLEPLKRVEQHLLRTLQAQQDRLAGHVQAALGVTLAPHEIVLDVPAPAPPPVDIGYVDATFNLMISPLIPARLFHTAIERSLLRISRWETEKNLSRLASNWSDRVDKRIYELTKQAEQQALDQMSALEQALRHSTSKVHDLKQAMDELEQIENQLRGD